MANIAWLNELNKDDIPLVGGKGANLGEMYNFKLPVPPAFIVTSEAFKKFLEATGIKNQIFGMLNNLDVDNTKMLELTSEKIKEIILHASISENMKADIIEAYDNLNVDEEVLKDTNNDVLKLVKTGRDMPFVAVRSSATAEDLPSIDQNSHVLMKIDSKPVYDTISNIYDKIGDGTNNLIEVASMQDNEVKWVRAEQIYRHPAKESKLYKINTETGRSIGISKNHSLIVLNPHTLKPIVTSVDNLKGDEMVPVTRNVPLINSGINEIDVSDYVNGKDVHIEENKVYIKNNSSNWKIQNPLPLKLKLDDEFAYFLGIYCAEGNTYKNNNIGITNTNNNILENVKGFLKKLNLYDKQKLNKGTIRVHCKSLVRFLHNTTGIPLDSKGKGRSCKIKKVPDFIFGCNKEIIGSFLGGCFDGDGYINSETIEYCSISEKLIGGIIKLLEMLDIDFYIRKKNNAFTIIIPGSEAAMFKKVITIKTKIEKIDRLINLYNSKKNHPKFLNSVFISNELSKIIKEKYNDKLVKNKVEAALCPDCGENIGKTSYYKNKLRYYCKCCGKTFYDVEKNILEKNINYDNNGRFVKRAIPWNKGILNGSFSRRKFIEIMEENGLNEYAELFNKSVLWDKISRIEEYDYNGDVYDFTVPNIENFVAGVGGIITHNTASFAGQQESYLNIKGEKQLLESIKKCWASLYTPRAIFYRIKNNFPHEKVLIAVVVQKMVNSKKAGVIFSVNPATNVNEIVIEAGFGLGEAVVSGAINPNLYILNKDTLEIKKREIKKQTWMFTRDNLSGQTVKKNINEEYWDIPTLTEQEIKKLGELTLKIEKHYGKPQDIEFAIDNKVYIVQSRPITTLNKIISKEEVSGELILGGLAASSGVGKGRVQKIEEKNISDFKEGNILVTSMTNPSFVPIMKKAKAIVTDEGGITSHAAIVSREMGIPCIVGTEKATKILKDGEEITVDATHGKVYRGIVGSIKEEKIEIDPELLKMHTDTRIYMNLGEPDMIEKYKKLPFDGIGLMRLEFMITESIKKHPNALIEEGRGKEYTNKLAEGIMKVAKTITPKPIVVRFSDFKTNEYKGLEGGDKFEPKEDNPLIGWRGVSRYISDEFQEAFRLECRAIKKVREQCKNVYVMLPFVRNTWEVKKCLDIMKEEGLERKEGLEIWIMVEVPSAVLILEEFLKLGIDGVSIGSNDLTCLILGVDRDSEKLSRMGYFDENDPAVLKAIGRVIDVCKREGVSVSCCGQAPSQYPKFAEFLVREGITSVSVNPDVVAKTKALIVDIERRI